MNRCEVWAGKGGDQVSSWKKLQGCRDRYEVGKRACLDDARAVEDYYQ